MGDQPGIKRAAQPLRPRCSHLEGLMKRSLEWRRADRRFRAWMDSYTNVGESEEEHGPEAQSKTGPGCWVSGGGCSLGPVRRRRDGGGNMGSLLSGSDVFCPPDAVPPSLLMWCIGIGVPKGSCKVFTSSQQPRRQDSGGAAAVFTARNGSPGRRCPCGRHLCRSIRRGDHSRGYRRCRAVCRYPLRLPWCQLRCLR